VIASLLRRETHLRRTASLAGLAVIISLFAASPAHTDGKPRLDGLWKGVIEHQPAVVEWDFQLEIAAAADGRLVGTLDLPTQRMKQHPLASVTLDGNRIRIEFDRFPGKQVEENRFRFEGELSPDSQKITGYFLGRSDGMDVRSPFTLERAANAGDETTQAVKPPPLTVLAGTGDALRDTFNRDKDKLRLVVLISPTCGSCLNSAQIVKRYLLDKVHDDSLRIYVLWGPMLGDEKEADAREATAFLADPRVTHYWTATNTLAAQFGRAVKLPEKELGWDTFQLFSSGATWGEALPTPGHFWHMNKPLPGELVLNGNALREQVCSSLKSCGS